MIFIYIVIVVGVDIFKVNKKRSLKCGQVLNIWTIKISKYHLV